MRTLRYLLLLSFATLALAPARATAKEATLTQEQIREVIRPQTYKVSRCYAKHAMKQKEADGKVELHLVIRASGEVESVEVDAPSVKGDKLERCVISVARRWRFPETATGTEVIYPFLFVHTHSRGAGPRRG